ncbi:hypothetical protein F0L74_14465 [Chitinophaga agrisoli]|uniref:YXWGXW repeat-containing protein n=1 Tax=Chitinophaga agrisoli TaxID=2607653 RepID=A0A5B2W043_9BACT|nr:YXWGXW repeat-containing protein [Chitinophaga agrisoli]KAA2243679.1 hypothetical protein F0L74_14465 [Chitinophaga agrisoli]
MERSTKLTILAVTLTGMLMSCAPRVGIVATRPPAPVVVRPVAPRPGAVWVDGDYIWQHGGYTYRPGYWVTPRRGRAYHPGHWRAVRNGWQWERGRWR